MSLYLEAMATIKWLYSFIEKIFLGFWGLTVIELIPILNLGLLKGIDDTIKIIMATVGAVYLIVQLPYKIWSLKDKKKSSKLDIELKKQELEKLKRENGKH
jgi:uncharacterized membrane protein YqjE